jgi:FMN-dependent NADH-azoreductase
MEVSIMAKLLYIKASPMGELSYSLAVADAFIEVYRKQNAQDEIEILDLFKAALPAFDFEAASAKYKIMHGKEHSPKDSRVWQAIVSLIDEFKSADKYVLAVPMWNFSIPYRLKQYIDILVQPGHTFTVTKEGNYEGLVKGKPVFIAYASGGQYQAGTASEAFDLQKKYLELILGFMGLTDIRSVTVEPTLAGGPETAKQKRAEAIEKARQSARKF